MKYATVPKSSAMKPRIYHTGKFRRSEEITVMLPNIRSTNILITAIRFLSRR